MNKGIDFELASLLNYASTNYRESIRIIEKLLKKDPNNILLFHELAFSYYMLEKNKKALKVLEMGLKVKSSFPLLFFKMEILEEEGRYQEAIDTANKILEHKPDNQATLYYKTLCLSNLEKYEEALTVVCSNNNNNSFLPLEDLKKYLLLRKKTAEKG